MIQQTPQYKKIVQRFATNIRQNARRKVMNQMRQQIHFQTQPIHKIAQLFKLPSKQYEEYSILEIMNQRYNELVYATDKLSKMAVEEQGSNKEVVTLEAHVNFWAYLLQELYTDKIGVDGKLEHFLIDFMNNNPYRRLIEYHLLQNKSLNTLQIAMASPNASSQIKRIALEWVKGTDGLILIHNTLPNQFLNPTQYPNVYQILKQALKIGNLQKLSQCSTVIKNIMRHADYDETFLIYTQQSDLMVNLLECIVKFVEDQDVDIYVDAVIYLLDSYEKLIFDYARMGVALLATRMIISRRQVNMLKGLEIIKFISEVESNDTQFFLLADKQLNNAGLWSTIFGTEFILFNRNISIKRQAYNIMANIMSNGCREHVEMLNDMVNLSEQKSLLDIIDYALKNEEDITILKYTLIMLSILLYYSQNCVEENQNQGESRENIIIQKIEEFELEGVLKNLIQHQNEQLVKNAQQLLKNINALQTIDLYNNC